MADKYPESAQKRLEVYAERLWNDATMQLQSTMEMLDLCESPLEQILLMELWYLFSAKVFFGLDGDIFTGDIDYKGVELSDVFVSIAPQRNIFIDNHHYRVDIMVSIEKEEMWPTGDIRFERHDGNFIVVREIPLSTEQVSLNSYGSVHLAIEVDGHDFHERTKEQARRDKQRDRLMQAMGITVFRYTGSEVYRDVNAVCWQIQEFVLNAARKVSTNPHA